MAQTGVDYDPMSSCATSQPKLTGEFLLQADSPEMFREHTRLQSNQRRDRAHGLGATTAIAGYSVVLA